MKALAISDQLWIVKSQGVKVGTVQRTSNGVRAEVDGKIRVFPDFATAKQDLNLELETVGPKSNQQWTVLGYPSHCLPCNAMIEASRRLPLYTETEESQCCYAAGYYLCATKRPGVWAEMFCPKYVSLLRREYHGPFVSREAMARAKQEL